MPIWTTGLHVLDLLYCNVQEDERHYGAGTLLLDGNRLVLLFETPNLVGMAQQEWRGDVRMHRVDL